MEVPVVQDGGQYFYGGWTQTNPIAQGKRLNSNYYANIKPSRNIFLAILVIFGAYFLIKSLSG